MKKSIKHMVGKRIASILMSAMFMSAIVLSNYAGLYPTKVYATSSVDHNIIVINDGHGTGSPDHPAASCDAIVILSATPNAGYVFYQWTTEDAINIINPTSANGANFNMIDSDVTVKANFILDPSTVVQNNDNNPPARTYLDDLSDKIKEMIALGGPQTIYWNEGNCLSYGIMKLLEENPQITLVYSYSYDGVDYKVTIPGKYVKTDTTIPWYGPLYLWANFWMYGENDISSETT